jgi:hypothetical protein
LYLWLGTIALAIVMVLTTRARNWFKPSTQDLLTILVVLAIVALPAIVANQSIIAAVAVRALVLLYACELLITLRPSRASVLGWMGVLALVAMATIHWIPFDT